MPLGVFASFHLLAPTDEVAFNDCAINIALLYRNLISQHSRVISTGPEGRSLACPAYAEE